MDILQLSMTTAVSTLVGAVVGAVVAYVLKSLGDSKRGYDEKTEAQQEAIKLLVMDKAKQLTHEAVKDGEITLEQRAFIKSLTAVAHKLGANGEMTACDEIVDSIPTKQ